MLSRISKILLVIVSIVYVIILAYTWIWKDLTSLTKAESLLLYGIGTVVIMGWIFVSVRGKKRK